MPLGIAIAIANVNDYKPTEETLESIPVARPEPTEPDAKGELHSQAWCLDADYFRAPIYELVEKWGYTAHIRPVGSGQAAELTPEERAATGVKARRWVVERTHSWINRFPALLIRCNKKPENYVALLHFALGLIAYRASGPLG